MILNRPSCVILMVNNSRFWLEEFKAENFLSYWTLRYIKIRENALLHWISEAYYFTHPSTRIPILNIPIINPFPIFCNYLFLKRWNLIVLIKQIPVLNMVQVFSSDSFNCHSNITALLHAHKLRIVIDCSYCVQYTGCKVQFNLNDLPCTHNLVFPIALYK